MVKKIILALVIVALIFMTGCAEVVSEVPIDARYTEAHEAIETKYVYKYDWGQGQYRLMPEIRTVRYDDKYEVEYERTYSDGRKDTYWVEVTKKEYEAVLATLEG